MQPDQSLPPKQRLDGASEPAPRPAIAPAGGNASLPERPAGSLVAGADNPLLRPGLGPRPIATANPLLRPRLRHPSAGAPTPATSGNVVPLARPIGAAPDGSPVSPPGTRPGPSRPPTRAGAVYRGLPLPIRVVGWFGLAALLGAVIGATAPIAVVRINQVLAIQPGLLAWYSVRALGFLAYFVLAASVLYGLLLSTKILDAIAHRPVSFSLHKDLSIVALVLASLHGALLVFDESFDFTVRSILLPFASPYAPVEVGIGQLGFYVSVVVTASFYVRRHIGQRAWRVLHYVTFLAFIGATYHGIASGSDTSTNWAFWGYVVPATASIFLLTYRIVLSVSSRVGRSRARRAGIPASLGPVRGPLDRPGAATGGF